MALETQKQPSAVESFLAGVTNHAVSGRSSIDVPQVLDAKALSDETAQMLERALGFDIALVRRRYVSEYGVSESEAREHEVELKRYLVLCATSLTPYTIVAPIDHFWHTFLLFTQLYMRFCDEIAGRFLHHVPADDSIDSGQEQFGRYFATLEAYREAFGIEAPPHIWPRFDPNTAVYLHPCTNCSS